MKSVLVLYPIQPYADVLIGANEAPEIKIKYAQIYQHILSKRYFSFRLIWVMFSESQSMDKPDISQLWQGISIDEKNDIVGACGVSFNDHCRDKLYPNSESIVKLCPQPIEELIIVGFHFWDCVEKVAKCAHEQGINVLVDDDLTEFFFYQVRDRKGFPSLKNIPLLREKSIEKNRKQFIKSGGSRSLERVRQVRKEKPWLFPI